MIAAEQKARSTYDNILRLVKDPEVADPIRFLREREIVHFQRFGEGESERYFVHKRLFFESDYSEHFGFPHPQRTTAAVLSAAEFPCGGRG